MIGLVYDTMPAKNPIDTFQQSTGSRVTQLYAILFLFSHRCIMRTSYKVANEFSSAAPLLSNNFIAFNSTSTVTVLISVVPLNSFFVTASLVILQPARLEIMSNLGSHVDSLFRCKIFAQPARRPIQ